MNEETAPLAPPPLGTPPAGGERRALAAVVFTDVVAFTKHAARDEPRTHAALRRDFSLFHDACLRHGGRVLNTMGDGSLMLFDSAVAAMEAALEMQRGLRAVELARPPEGVLEHRIGVHLGDVVQGPPEDGAPNGKVFGDGINVASRIESLSRAGAVTYSRAVAEVIRGKLEPGGVYLGPRAAKNVAEPISLWEVPPIAERERGRAAAAFLPAAVPAEQGATGRKGAMLALLGIVVLALGFGGIAALRAADAKRHRNEDPLLEAAGRGPRRHARPVRTNDAITNAPSPTSVAGARAQAGNAENGSAGNASVGNAMEGAGGAIAPLDPAALARKLREMREGYDFAGIVEMLRGAKDAAPALAGDVLARYQTLAALRTWADSALAATSVETPVPLGEGWPTPGAAVFSDAGSPMLREPGKPDAALALWSRSPRGVLAVLAALARSPGATPPPAGALETFATEYGLSDR